MDALNNRAIRAAGTPDSAWVPWLASQQLPLAAMQTLCPDESRLVVVAPHPDDEVLACGGLLAMRAERGLPTLVIAVTDGEASHNHTDNEGLAHLGASLGANLGARRAKESCAGLLVLGVPRACVVRLGIADGNASDCISEIARKLQALVKPSDVLVTTWCLDGHPDHESVSQAAMQACLIAGCRLLQAPVWMWHWAEPDDSRVPWGDLVALNLPDYAIAAKQRALAQHRSQLAERGSLGPVLMPSIVERASRSQEFYFQ